MGNKDSKETQSAQESDESDADSSLAENLSVQLRTHKEHGDNNEHDTILGRDGYQLDVNMATAGTSTVTSGDADADVLEHINHGVSSTIKGSPKSTTDRQSTNSKEDNRCKLLAYIYCISEVYQHKTDFITHQTLPCDGLSCTCPHENQRGCYW